MPDFLILRLDGPMQAWGRHTYEDFRPSEVFPTRSGLVGLLGACLGIERADKTGLVALSNSFRYAARADVHEGHADARERRIRKIADFHTVMDARSVSGKPREFPVVSSREYLCDAQFTLAAEFAPNAAVSLETVREAVRRPKYTPFLGRRSCPLAQPLYLDTLTADDLHGALALVEPKKGVIYSEDAGDSPNRMTLRDVPTAARHRQFAMRTVFIHAEGDE
jgi:CRISPR system Cascade subunit CasD